jgi:ribosomal-protein-alanine N-acetyltransferase
MAERIFPQLETQRLILREFQLSDVPAVYEMYTHPDLIRHLPGGPMKSFQEAEKKVQSRINLFRTIRMGFRWAITLKQDPNTIIGSCGFYYPISDFHSIETGYELHPDHWRQGIMTEALIAIFSFGFNGGFSYPLNRIIAITHPTNTASKNLLTKLGFKREGILREYAYWDEQYHDHLLYSLLKREWTFWIINQTD